LKKRFFAALLAVLMITNICACNYTPENDVDDQTKEDTKEETVTPSNTENEPITCVEIQDLIFVSNGDGTCCVSGVKKDKYTDKRLALEIPEHSPDGDKVTGIERFAFENFNNLEYVKLDNNVTYIGDSAFLFCKGLKKIQLSDKLVSIGSGSFSGCTNLKEIALPQKLQSIGDGAFSVCNKLESVNIPTQVSEIGNGIFYACDSLTTITVDKMNPVFYSSGNCVINKETKSVIAGCNSSVIPQTDDVIAISSKAIVINSSTFTIPSNIKKIDPFGVYDHSTIKKLKTITFTGTLEEWYVLIGDDIYLNDWNNDLTVHCTDGSKPSVTGIG